MPLAAEPVPGESAAVTVVVADDPCGGHCLTKAEVAGYSECLMNWPECRHARLFGYTSLCRHPRHREFRIPRK